MSSVLVFPMTMSASEPSIFSVINRLERLEMCNDVFDRAAIARASNNDQMLYMIFVIVYYSISGGTYFLHHHFVERDSDRRRCFDEHGRLVV